MSKSLIVKDNALINASYSLSLTEQRLILLAIVETRRTKQEITPNKFLVIQSDRYINEFGVHRNVAYQALKDACKNLFERRFSYQKLSERGNLEHVTSRWVQSVSYVENEGVVKLKFADDVIPLITMLESHFTSYELEQVAGLNSKYAVRLYEIVIAWRSKGQTNQIEMQELRNRLGLLDNEYTAIHNFKARVLQASIDEINEKTDITLSYEQHKQGRKIIGFTFSIKQKKKSKKAKAAENRDENTVDMLTPLKMTDKQRLMFANKLSELPELGACAPVGMEYSDYAKYIANELLDPRKAEFYRPYLEKVGFKP